MRWLGAEVVRVFAIVLACTTCRAHPAELLLPPPRISGDAGVAAIDARPDAPPDASPEVAVPDAAIRTCNDCEPPLTSITGRVIKVEIDGARTIFWVGIGTAQGVSKSWRGVLVRADGVVVPGGGVKTLRVARTTTIVESALTTDQIITGLSVRFDPPE